MIQAHDIVLFDKHEIEGFPLPEWVVLTEKMFGTVRRASTDHAEILPIGLRGPARNQRWATEISKHAVKQVIHPWDIIEQESYRHKRKSWIILFISNFMLLETYYQDASGESAAA